MARKPKAQLHPDVAAALPVALAAMDHAPAPAGQGRKAKADAPSPGPSAPGHDDTAAGGVDADADGGAPAEAPRRKGPHRSPTPPAIAAAAPLLEGSAPGRRGPKRRTPQPDAVPERVGNEAQSHEGKPQTESDASTDPVPMDTAPAMPSDDAQPPLPGLNAPSSAQPAAHWDRAMDTVRFDWPAIERTAAQEGPNQGMAKLLVAARAEGANSRWPL